MRAAIEESNATSGKQLINFNIQDQPDFINQGVGGFSIEPEESLPALTESVEINGFSQPGSRPNTIPAPVPMNAINTIEISGRKVLDNQPGISVLAPNVSIKGLTINEFKNDGIGIGGDSLTIQGTYIGTDPSGMIDKGNTKGGASQLADGSTDVKFGGPEPADRVLISGNDEGGSSPNFGSDGWIYEGVIAGLSSDQAQSIQNAQLTGAGALSLDNSKGHRVKDSVLSGNGGHGLAPYNSDNVIVEGSLIGVNYLGQQFPNAGEGITFGSGSENALVKDSVVSNNRKGGIGFYWGSDNGRVINSKVDNNENNGITIFDSSNIKIGEPSHGNIIRDNGGSSVEVISVPFLYGFSLNNIIQSNYLRADSTGKPNSIGTITLRSGTEGTLIGGEDENEQNEIININGPSISTQSLSAPAIDFLGVPHKNTVLGNKMLGGMDLLGGYDTSNPIDGIIDEIVNSGQTPNDPGDFDQGPNDYINTPEISRVELESGVANIDFNLDAAGSDENLADTGDNAKIIAASASGLVVGSLILKHAVIDKRRIFRV